jgi:hypothetical protein
MDGFDCDGCPFKAAQDACGFPTWNAHGMKLLDRIRVCPPSGCWFTPVEMRDALRGVGDALVEKKERVEKLEWAAKMLSSTFFKNFVDDRGKVTLTESEFQAKIKELFK